MKLIKSKPVPKVEQEAGFSFKAVWRRVSCSVLAPSDRDSLFLLIHNKLPVRERLFRIGLALDPYCEVCPSAEICDVGHFFCSCYRVSQAWQGVRAMLERVLGVNCDNCSDLQLVSLHFPASMGGTKGVWLMGTFVSWVWEEIFIRGAPVLKKEHFFGYLKFKYKIALQLGCDLGVFPGLAE